MFGLPFLPYWVFLTPIPRELTGGRVYAEVITKCHSSRRFSFVSLLLSVTKSTVATASKKVTMITSTHNLPLSSLR